MKINKKRGSASKKIAAFLLSIIFLTTTFFVFGDQSRSDASTVGLGDTLGNVQQPDNSEKLDQDINKPDTVDDKKTPIFYNIQEQREENSKTQLVISLVGEIDSVKLIGPKNSAVTKKTYL